MSDKERMARGRALVEKYMGTFPASAAGAGGASDAFLEMTVGHLFGEVWTREGLPLPARSMLTVGVLAALGREPELRMHLRGARHIGIPLETIEEIMIHIAHYAGWPAGLTGTRVAREIYAEDTPKKEGT